MSLLIHSLFQSCFQSKKMAQKVKLIGCDRKELLQHLYKHRSEEETNVRLCCDDGQVLAHKEVLAHLSQHLSSLLSELGCAQEEHTNIIFPNVSYRVMHNFVTLAYLGQCSVVYGNRDTLRDLAANLSVTFNVALLEKATFVCNRCGTVFVNRQRRKHYASCKYPSKPDEAPSTTIPQEVQMEVNEQVSKFLLCPGKPLNNIYCSTQ